MSNIQIDKVKLDNKLFNFDQHEIIKFVESGYISIEVNILPKGDNTIIYGKEIEEFFDLIFNFKIKDIVINEHCIDFNCHYTYLKNNILCKSSDDAHKIYNNILTFKIGN